MYYRFGNKGSQLMAARPSSIRIPDETRSAIEENCRSTGRDFSSVANEMLSEAVKMRRIPGMVFADGPSGRVARVAGTGLEVFEIIRAFLSLDKDWGRLKTAYHWLSEVQLRAALAYAEAYPEEIDGILEEERQLTPEHVWAKYPFSKPPYR
ncbi:MAG: hypothetical protein HY675_16230 [Chloroflexi bacterium]|nr:hypothetical protein [Chloroflexota bacterium]